MARFLLYSAATGIPANILSLGVGQAPNPGAGYSYIELAEGVDVGRGDTVVNGALVHYVQTLPDDKVTKIADATAAYEGKIGAGYTHADGHVFQLGPDKIGSTGVFNLSAIAQLAQQAMGGDTAAWPTGAFIRDAANDNVVYAPEEALAVATGAGIYVTALRKNFWSITAAISAAADPGQLGAVDVTAGYDV